MIKPTYIHMIHNTASIYSNSTLGNLSQEFKFNKSLNNQCVESVNYG